MSESTQFKGLEARILRTLDESSEYPTATILARQYKIGKVQIKAALGNLAEAGVIRVGDEPGSIGDHDPIERREPQEELEFQEEPEPEAEPTEEPEAEPQPEKRVGRKPLMEIEVREYTPEELEAMTPEERKALKRAKRQVRRRAARAAQRAQN